MTKISPFSLLARAEDLKPLPRAVPEPIEGEDPNKKILVALYKQLAGRDLVDTERDQLYAHYSRQLPEICFHPVFKKHPELMPAAVIANMRPFQRPGNGLKPPVYLQFVEAGRRTVSVEILAGQEADVVVPSKLVLCVEIRGKMIPTRSKMEIKLTKEALYKLAGIQPDKSAVEEGMPLLVVPGLVRPLQPSLFPSQQILAAYLNPDTMGRNPDGSKARNRKKSGPSGSSGFSCIA